MSKDHLEYLIPEEDFSVSSQISYSNGIWKKTFFFVQ